MFWHWVFSKFPDRWQSVNVARLSMASWKFPMMVQFKNVQSERSAIPNEASISQFEKIAPWQSAKSNAQSMKSEFSNLLPATWDSWKVEFEKHAWEKLWQITDLNSEAETILTDLSNLPVRSRFWSRIHEISLEPSGNWVHTSDGIVRSWGSPRYSRVPVISMTWPEIVFLSMGKI